MLVDLLWTQLEIELQYTMIIVHSNPELEQLFYPRFRNKSPARQPVSRTRAGIHSLILATVGKKNEQDNERVQNERFDGAICHRPTDCFPKPDHTERSISVYNYSEYHPLLCKSNNDLC